MKKAGVEFLIPSMGRRPDLSINDRNIALRVLEAGLYATGVAGRLG
jgi:hypothetical protein